MEMELKPVEIEVRGGGVHIEGYVNAVLRESRPVVTPRGKVNEIVEQRTFQNAIDKSDNIDILVDHEKSKKVGSTSQGNLTLKEDEIGLRATTDITDPYVVEKAKKNQIKGWSFGFKTNKDSLEMRDNKLPLRHLKDIDLKEVSLIIDKTPCYSATSVEVRAGNEEILEQRYYGEIETDNSSMTQDPVKPDEDKKVVEEKVKTQSSREVETKVSSNDIDESTKSKVDSSYMEFTTRIIKLKRRM